MERCLKQIGLFLIVHLFVMILLGPSLAQEREIRIADSTGDWGYPNPYRHYPRGPGYIRMSWVFDTLSWSPDLDPGDDELIHESQGFLSSSLHLEKRSPSSGG